MNPSTPPSRSPAASASQRSATRRVVAASGIEGRRDHDEAGDPVGVLEREAQQRVRAHRRAGQHGAVEPERVEHRAQVVGEVGVGVVVASGAGDDAPVAARVVGDDAVAGALGSAFEPMTT